MKTINTPICKVELQAYERYPNYLCPSCASKATDKHGRLLCFGNINLSGGFEAFYLDKNEKFDSHICYINDIESYVDEARFGGIVIKKSTKA